MESTTNQLQCPKCPQCNEPLTVIYGMNRYELTWVEGWVKGDKRSTLVCSDCYEELDEEVVEEVLRATSGGE